MGSQTTSPNVSPRSLLSHQCQRHSSKERRCQVVRIPTLQRKRWAFCTKISPYRKVALGLRTHTWFGLMCCCWETKAWLPLLRRAGRLQLDDAFSCISQGPRSCQIGLTNGWRRWSTNFPGRNETERTHLKDLKSTESRGQEAFIHCAYLVGLSADYFPYS